jgi:hypothetical protein
MEKSGDGGLLSTLAAFVLSVLLDHWVEIVTLSISIVGLYFAVRNYVAAERVKILEAEKLTIEIAGLRAETLEERRDRESLKDETAIDETKP